MKVYLHIGAGKTGTSAIQVALAQHRAQLWTAGVHYPTSPGDSDRRAERGEISSGNGVPLGSFLNPAFNPWKFTEEDVLTWVDRSITQAAGRDLIFSSEMMQFARSEQAVRLVDLFSRRSYEPVIIFYVRHVLDMAIAEYLQHLKIGSGFFKDKKGVSNINGYVRNYKCRYLQSLNPFLKILPRQAFVVRLYDAERKNLLQEFFSIFSKLVPMAAEEKFINRSLSPEEVPVFEKLAELPDGEHLCRWLSDTLLNSPPISKTLFRIAVEDFDTFCEANQEIVERINADFLLGRNKLHMKSEKAIIGECEPFDPDQVYRILTTYLAASIRRIKTMQNMRHKASQ